MTTPELRLNRIAGHFAAAPPTPRPITLGQQGYVFWAEKTDKLGRRQINSSAENLTPEQSQRLAAIRNMDFAAQYGTIEDFEIALRIYKNLA